MWYICHIIFLYLKRNETIFVINYIHNENLNIFIEYISEIFLNLIILKR